VLLPPKDASIPGSIWVPALLPDAPDLFGGDSGLLPGPCEVRIRSASAQPGGAQDDQLPIGMWVLSWSFDGCGRSGRVWLVGQVSDVAVR
jgi:hypothetical protein